MSLTLMELASSLDTHQVKRLGKKARKRQIIGKVIATLVTLTTQELCEL